MKSKTSRPRRARLLLTAPAALIAVAALVAAITHETSLRAQTNPLNSPAIATESGPVMGIATGLMSEYLGIPYAAPPVGALRWTPPQSFGRWQGVLQATQFGSECPQDGGGDENCLFLNVYAPNVQTGQDRHNGLPVMVWIHGGGLTSGVSSDFDPTPLMQAGGVIVVTINYRLGVLGFFAHPAIDGEGHLA